MHFTCPQTHLQRGLTLVGHAVAKGSPSLTLLTYLRMELSDGRLKLSATNLEISQTVWIQITAKEDSREGVIAVPARLFINLVNTLAEGDIEILVDLETGLMQIKHAYGMAEVQGQSAEQFPAIPDVGEGQWSIPLPVVALKNAIKGVSVSVDRDFARPLLNCILVQVEAGKITFAAADGMRVSYDELTPPSGDMTAFGNILIPQAALSELASMLPPDGAVLMSLTPNRSQVLFHTQWFTMTALLMSGEFPNYRGVVPRNIHLRAVVKTAEFLRIVQLTRVFASENQIAHLTIKGSRGMEPGLLTVASERTEMGSNSNTITAAVEGNSLEIAFNVRFLLEALHVVTTPDVALEIGFAEAAKTPASAGFIKPVGAPGCVHCFISMKINEERAAH